MDLQDPKVLTYVAFGAVGLAAWYLYRNFSSASSGDSAASSPLVTYVSPGNPTAAYSPNASDYAVWNGSQSTPNDSTGMITDATGVAAAANKATDAQLSYLNTDALLATVGSLVSQQQDTFGFSGASGFSSDIQGAITLNGAGSPSFTMSTEFTPKDPSNASLQITDLTNQVGTLTGKVNTLTGQLKAANASASSYLAQLSNYKAQTASAKATISQWANTIVPGMKLTSISANSLHNALAGAASQL